MQHHPVCVDALAMITRIVCNQLSGQERNTTLESWADILMHYRLNFNNVMLTSFEVETLISEFVELAKLRSCNEEEVKKLVEELLFYSREIGKIDEGTLDVLTGGIYDGDIKQA